MRATAGSRRRRGRQGSRCRPSARDGGGCRTARRERGSAPTIELPRATCRLTMSYSSSVSAPGLRRIPSGTRPCPCRGAARPQERVHQREPQIDLTGKEERVRGDVLGVPPGVAILRVDRGDQPLQDAEGRGRPRPSRCPVGDPGRRAAAGLRFAQDRATADINSVTESASSGIGRDADADRDRQAPRSRERRLTSTSASQRVESRSGGDSLHRRDAEEFVGPEAAEELVPPSGEATWRRPAAAPRPRRRGRASR